MKQVAPILLIFFNRPDTLALVFEQVRNAKPAKLYLAQDGARDNRSDDIENIKKCREIVSNIDWDCNVICNYADKNNGCGRGPQRAIDWFFENEEEGIILEDDCVADPSFFIFCSEMLNKYRNDERVFLITGCNLELQSKNISESYFFGYSGTNWGWATWKRNWKKMDYACSWVKDDGLLTEVGYMISNINKRAARQELHNFKQTNKLVNAGANISYWDVQFQAIRYLNHQLSIIPQKNLITNIGLGATSTHAQTVAMPQKEHSKMGRINFCYNKRFALCEELIHPKYVVENINYDRKVYNALYPSYFVKVCKKLQSIIRNK